MDLIYNEYVLAEGFPYWWDTQSKLVMRVYIWNIYILDKSTLTICLFVGFGYDHVVLLLAVHLLNEPMLRYSTVPRNLCLLALRELSILWVVFTTDGAERAWWLICPMLVHCWCYDCSCKCYHLPHHKEDILQHHLLVCLSLDEASVVFRINSCKQNDKISTYIYRFPVLWM